MLNADSVSGNPQRAMITKIKSLRSESRHPKGIRKSRQSAKLTGDLSHPRV